MFASLTSLKNAANSLRPTTCRTAGKVVEDFNGKFAWVVDAEGNKVELWEPKPGY
jgi:hypothetical protein